MNPKQKNALLVVAFLLLVILFYFSKRAKTPPPPPSSDLPLPTVEVAPPVNPVLPPPPVAQNTVQGPSYEDRMAAGITSVVMPLKPEGVEITLRFSQRPVWCTGGELDIMQRLATTQQNPEFLLSIEAFAGYNKPLWQQALATGDMTDHVYHFILPLPKNKKFLLGLYLCHDREQKGKCRGKPQVDFMRQAHNAHGSLPKKDNVFLFHKLLVDTGTGNIEMFSAFGGKKQIATGDAYLNSKGIPGNRDEVGEASRMADALRSVPLQVVDNMIDMPVTVADKRCTRTK